ncbi:MAG TPA: hypothetical protein VMJ73_11510 [Rhizomicrobium sp.]|nr:hypothetical protein [Rhizomicrobium sp.]
MIHFLATNSLAVTLERAAILGLFGWVVKLIKQYIAHLREVRDLLDTSKPGGLTEVVKALDKKPATRARKTAPKGDA